MNLQSLTAGVVAHVNPTTSITIQQSTGYTTGADGTQTPTYTTTTAQGQVQPLSANDLKRIEGLSAQEITHKVILPGNWEGVFRKTGKGGDLLEWGGYTYLVTEVLERWPTWTALGVTLQLD